MTAWERLKNLWKLSAYEPAIPGKQYWTPGTQITQLVKEPKPAVFIPHNKRDPVKEIVQQHE